MAKFYGRVGYSVTEETRPGIWTNAITEHTYYGDVLKDSTKWQSGKDLNDDLTVNNRISILADQYAYQHFSQIKYVEWMGALWKVTNVEVQRPRLILTIGGVYNGEQAGTS